MHISPRVPPTRTVQPQAQRSEDQAVGPLRLGSGVAAPAWICPPPEGHCSPQLPPKGLRCSASFPRARSGGSWAGSLGLVSCPSFSSPGSMLGFILWPLRAVYLLMGSAVARMSLKLHLAFELLAAQQQFRKQFVTRADMKAAV